MSNPDAPVPQRRLHPWQRRRRRALLLVLIITTPFAVLFFFRMRLNAENDRMIEALHAEGLPTTPEELSAWYPEVPKEENAAPLYLAAHEATEKLLPAQADLIPYTGHGPEFELSAAFPEETLARMAEYRMANAEALSLLHRAAQKKECRYPVDFAKGKALELPHLDNLRGSTWLLCIEGAWAAETGDAPRAVRAFLDILAVAESLRNEPLLISQFERIYMHGTASDLLAHLLSRTSLPEEALAQIHSALRKAHDPEALLKALGGEQCMGLAAFRDSQLLGKKQALGRPVAGAFQVIGFGEVDLRYFLGAYRIILDGARKTFPEALATGKAVEDYVRGLPPLLSIGTKLLVPALGGTGSAFARDEATLREMETAIAIERYRQKKDTLPDTLDALVPDFLPAVSADPFDGAPLRYRKGEAEYTLYSVYENRIDDGGMQQPLGKKRQQQPLDWAFRVVLPE